jgi:hypothetical protein
VHPVNRLSPVVLLVVLSCGWFPLLPDTRTPADHARGMTAKCAGESEQRAASALSATLVESVEPAYRTVDSGNDRAIRLRGARLHLRPSLNVSAEALERTLECHQARVALGESRAIVNDPYVLPGAWLDIDVDSTGDGLVAAVEVSRFDDARRVLDRARSFASGRP